MAMQDREQHRQAILFEADAEALWVHAVRFIDQRLDLGSYLGMKLETVSRLFSKFQADGLIEVNQKYVGLHNIEGLREIYAHHTR